MKRLTFLSLALLAGILFTAQADATICPATDYDVHCPGGQIKWQVDHRGCPYKPQCLEMYTTDEPCPNHYAPVCAFKDGMRETYRNICYARTDGAVLSYERACGWFCSREYAPVCAMTMGGIEQTYLNACEANADGAAVSYEGECEAVWTEPQAENTNPDWPIIEKEEVYNFWPTFPFRNVDKTRPTRSVLNWQKYQEGLRERSIFREYIREKLHQWRRDQ